MLADCPASTQAKSKAKSKAQGQAQGQAQGRAQSASEQTSLPPAINPIACFQAMWRNRLYGMYVMEVVEGGADFRFLAFNDAMANMSPVPIDLLKGKLLSEALHPQDARRYQQHYAHCIQSGHIIEFQETFVDGDQTTWWSLSVDPVKDDSGDIYQLIVTAADTSDKCRAEAALQESRQVLQKVIDTVPSAIFWKDRESRYLGCNQSFLQMAGLNHVVDIIGKNDYDMVWKPEESDWFVELDKRVMSNNCAELDIVEPLLNASGRQSWLKTSKLPLNNNKGDVIGVLGIVEDITEKKSIQDEQARLLAILEATPDVIGIIDSSGRHRYLNQAGYKLFGIAPPETQQFHISDTAPSEFVDILLEEALPQAAETGIWRGESAIKNGEGQEIPVSLVIICHKDNEGAVAYFSSITRDISDRKASEIILRKNAERHAVLNQITMQVRNSLDLDTVIATALMAVHNGLKLDYCGFAWLDNYAESPTWQIIQAIDDTDHGILLGEQPDDQLGPDIQALANQAITRVDDAEKCSNLIHQAFLKRLGICSEILVPIRTDADKTGVIICCFVHEAHAWAESEVELLQAVGDQLAIAINQANLYTQSCHQSQQLVNTLDQLKRTQAQIIQAEKMSSLGQMVAGVAHEINNPVNFIYGNLEPAQEYTQDLIGLIDKYQAVYPNPSAEIEAEIDCIDLDFVREDLPKLLDSMVVGTERIREIVLSLRNFSRLDEAAVKTVDVHEGIDSTLVILSHRLKSSNTQGSIEVIKRYGQLPEIDCYPSQLNQVLMNILSNAVDALEEETQPQITLTTESQYIDGKEYALIRIADNGTGIPEEIRPQILDPFFTTKPVGKGTGMGMSISYQIITEKHGGNLSFSSEIGEGTEFVITIPMKQPEAT